MPEEPVVIVPVKLKFWEAYRLTVVLTAIAFRKLLCIWGLMALLTLVLVVLWFFRPPRQEDWELMVTNLKPLRLALGIPLVFLFVFPLLSARTLLKNEILKHGVNYQFSVAGMYVETSVSKSEFVWGAIHRVKEISSEFFVFTSPKTAFALPKRCFEKAQEVSALRELFRAHVGKSDLARV